MQLENDSHRPQEAPAGKAWEAPEVDVLPVDQTKNSSFAANDGIFAAS
jgi:hypothetical protein